MTDDIEDEYRDRTGRRNPGSVVVRERNPARTWPLERTERLRELWASGMVTRMIARELGITKNAVIGKAHRLRLERRPSPVTRRVVALPVVTVGCQWIDGDPMRPGWVFCGAERRNGSSYCGAHHARCWRRAA